MALNTKTFLTRLGSAIIFSALMLYAFLSNEWVFISLFFIINLICLFEYVRIIEKIINTSFSKNEKKNFYIFGSSLYLLTCSLKIGRCENFTNDLFNHFFYYFLGIMIGSGILFFIFKRSKKSLYILTGLGYITIAFALFTQLRYQSILYPIIILLFIWMNDSLAYLTGSFFGKRKFFPSISPNKTIEGTLGGIFFTMAFAIIWGYFTDYFPLWQWISLGLITSIVGTIGDLIESKLKRLSNIKDSGNIMPGHGGALDRFDSLIFVAPFAFLFGILFLQCIEMKIF
ncbi:MAG TPA: phosphatidate cytidylyltransferase [Chitinophagaceae bacterium]|nr:MAG: phosphatidate cytidylyltransferase [Bacteroidetes bacterium OLB11]HMN32962.1 phosphatidate cytidylyltransferase [Chitinophagaceae bacterium]